MGMGLIFPLLLVASVANADVFRDIEATHNAGRPMTTIMSAEPAQAWEQDFEANGRGVALVLDGRWSTVQPELGLARWDWRGANGETQRGWLAIWLESGEITHWYYTPKPPHRRRYTDAAGQAADVATTAGALATGLAELNPVVDTLGLPVAGALKLGGTLWATHADYPRCRSALPALGTLGWSATIWNVGVLAGTGGAAIVPAIAVGALTWDRDRFWECLPKDLARQDVVAQ